tara:strand:- start:106 stop:798 length:693 start_codon:yes stop_codon:yes gene_type:complete
MILKDDGETTVDYFSKFPSNIENIGLSLSGGMDSALILWCLVEMLRGREDYWRDVKIWCMHGYDTHRTKTHSYEAAQRVLDWVKWYHRDTTIIQPLHVFAYDKTRADQSKMQFHKPNEEYLKRRRKCDVVITGITQDHTGHGRTNNQTNAYFSNQDLAAETKISWRYPFGAVNKEFIAHQYKHYELHGLRAITVSCTADSKTPCQKCFWCQERFWAFGDYDGGQKRRIVL